MHTFSIQTNPNLSASIAAFGRLNPAICAYIADEPDLRLLGRILGGVNKQYLALSHLSLNPAVALKRMGCLNVDALCAASEYDCGFLGPGSRRYCLVPLGIVVNQGISGLRKYADAFKDGGRDGARPEVLHLLPDASRFDEHLLPGLDNDGEGRVGGAPEQYQVSRFEQLFVGCGHTRDMLAAGDASMELRPVGLALCNGDTLLAYAYRDTAV